MDADSAAIVGRLAPSPTGGLHLGHARTFFAAWLAARSAGGRILLRIEDLDAARVRPEATAVAIDDLRWLGLRWDEGPDVGGASAPYIQSQRLAGYMATLERLKARELVYPCTCTRADIARASSAPHAEDEGPTYPGTCAGRSAADSERLGDRPFAWRFRVPRGQVEWNDLFLGDQTANPSEVGGDFIAARHRHGPSYQLAVVHDDATMGVNQVIRGNDLVPSTPRQVLLYRALGWSVPRFGHLPLVVGPDGRRLAKRDGSIKLATLRRDGVDPLRLICWLAMSLGMADRVEPTPPEGWIERFSIARVPAVPQAIGPDEVAGWMPLTTNPPAGSAPA
jgi:glutamyl-tRNA synthetase